MANPQEQWKRLICVLPFPVAGEPLFRVLYWVGAEDGMDGLPAVGVAGGPAPAGGAEVGDHGQSAPGYGAVACVARDGHAVGAVPYLDPDPSVTTPHYYPDRPHAPHPPG